MTTTDKLTFAIHGMGCEGCVAAIENAVMPMTGVAYVGVSLSGMTITVRPAEGFDASALEVSILSMGYGFEGLEPSGSLGGGCKRCLP